MYPLYLVVWDVFWEYPLGQLKTSSYSLSLGFLSLKYNKFKFKCQKCLGFWRENSS